MTETEHAREGHCTCEREYEDVVTGGLLFPPGIIRRYTVALRYSETCGISEHRAFARHDSDQSRWR